MSCTGCGESVDSGARFCGRCGAPQTEQCRACGESMQVGAEFCIACGHRAGSVTPGLTMKRAEEWQRIFQDMDWADIPQGGVAQVLTKLYQSLDADDEMLPIFFTKLADKDWKIRDFKIDGSKVEGSGEKSKRWGRRALIAGSLVVFPPAALGALAMKRSDEMWLLATRDRFVLFNVKDEQVWQWPFADINEGWVDHKGTFRLFPDDGSQVEFHVKARGTKLINAWRIAGNMLDDESPYREYVRANAVHRREDANLDFMQTIKKFLEDVAACN